MKRPCIISRWEITEPFTPRPITVQQRVGTVVRHRNIHKLTSRVGGIHAPDIAHCLYPRADRLRQGCAGRIFELSLQIPHTAEGYPRRIWSSG